MPADPGTPAPAELAAGASPPPGTAGAAREGRPLHVLAVTNLWPSQGNFRGVYVKELVENLRALGHQVDVEVIAQERGKLDYLTAALRVRRRARRGDYDLVHVHYGLSALAARLVTWLPRVVTLYGSDINSPRQRWFTRLGWGGAAEKIYTSRRQAALAGEPDGTVIACGVDTTVFAPIPRGLAREQLGLPAQVPIVLFGSAPSTGVKGYDLFSEVLSALRQQGLPVRELILAEPDQPRQRVAAKFAAADLLLVTSRRGSETGPIVVKEAVVMGLPVVSVDVGDVRDVLAHVSPAAVVSFPPGWGSPPARAQLVAELADQAGVILRAGTRGDVAQAAARWDARVSAQRIVGVYRRVLTQRVP